eukprot:2154227-Heterocapsa_arctica.AAC.1
MEEAPMSRKEAMIQFNKLEKQGQQEAGWKCSGLPGPGQGSFGDEHDQGGGEDHHRLDGEQRMGQGELEVGRREHDQYYRAVVERIGVRAAQALQGNAGRRVDFRHEPVLDSIMGALE